MVRVTNPFKVALGSYEFSAKFRVAEKKLGQNSAVQIDRRSFCMSREFAGGATLKCEVLGCTQIFLIKAGTT